MLENSWKIFELLINIDGAVQVVEGGIVLKSVYGYVLVMGDGVFRGVIHFRTTICFLLNQFLVQFQLKLKPWILAIIPPTRPLFKVVSVKMRTFVLG
jgi:hypothetical protein